jgi:mannitol/fructose-specific phosphotransferase system IIA component (Ntr-type)/Kef-type K+ transport system membrane component KefB
VSFERFYMQIFSLGLLVLVAHFGSRITRRLKLGEVVGQVIGGLLVGPVLLLFIGQRFPAYSEAIHSLHFFTFVFLSLIAFGIGDELNRGKLRSLGRGLLFLSLIEAFTTWIFVTGAFLLLGFKPIVAFLIGSIGIATEPAATFAIMNKLDIGGRMRSVLGGMVVLDDIIEIVVFSITCQAALLMASGASFSLVDLTLPVTRELGLALLIGLGIFVVLRLTLKRRWLQPEGGAARARSFIGPEFLSRLISELPGPSVDVFIIVAGSVCIGVGVALHWHLPFLITAAGAGVLISNFYSREVFKSLRIESATFIYTLIFFALIGANADLRAFRPENLLPIGAYIVARSAGKMGGSWLGCRAMKVEPRISRVLPRLMLPQAGVAAVEAFYVAAVLGADGQTVLGIILPGLIFFEVVGVLSSERALIKWRSWMTGGGELICEEDIIRDKLKKEPIAVSQVLPPDLLRVPLDVSSKGEAIWELIRTIQQAGFIDNPGRVLETILERERQGGVTLGDGIAIPHARLPELKRPVVALGVLPPDRPIQVGGAGDRLVDIIYLVLSPPEPPGLHIQVLAAIARLLRIKEAREGLRRAKDPQEAMEIINTYSTQPGECSPGTPGGRQKDSREEGETK